MKTSTKNPILHVRLLGREEKKNFFSMYKKSTPRYITHSSVYSAFHELKCIGGLVLDRKPVNSLVDIFYIYISPKYRGFGLGEKLISQVLKKNDTVTITTGLYTCGALKHILAKLKFKILKKLGNITYWIFEKEKVLVAENSLDWFCKKYQCKMLKSVCLKRQFLASLPANFQRRSVFYDACYKCQDGFKEMEKEI